MVFEFASQIVTKGSQPKNHKALFQNIGVRDHRFAVNTQILDQFILGNLVPN